jgi:cytochrome-b5 reductase
LLDRFSGQRHRCDRYYFYSGNLSSKTDRVPQSFRSYATEASSGSSRTPLVLGVGAIAAAAAGYVYYNGSAPAAAEAAKEKVKGEVKEPAKTFTGGDQGFIDLKLAEVTHVNHNTKRFRFELPEKDAVSGLTTACQ